MKSAYEILGIAQNASEEDIKSAFRRYSKVLHPDINKRATAATEFKELKRAYDTLIDRSERQKHDYALAVVETKDAKRDLVDDVLEGYEISIPKKKKKKKKKKVEQQQAFQGYAQPVPPPYTPPQPQRYGQGYFEGIPPDYEDLCDLGGVL